MDGAELYAEFKKTEMANHALGLAKQMQEHDDAPEVIVAMMKAFVADWFENVRAMDTNSCLLPFLDNQIGDILKKEFGDE